MKFKRQKADGKTSIIMVRQASGECKVKEAFEVIMKGSGYSLPKDFGTINEASIKKWYIIFKNLRCLYG